MWIRLGKISYLLYDRRFFLSDKPFLTYKQQINLLTSKNILVPDVYFAQEVLSSISYYNIINGYKDIFETYYDTTDGIEKFANKVTLENLHQVYLIDNSFNNLLFKYIIYIENTLKTKIAYNVAMNIGQRQSEYLDYEKYINNKPLDRKQVIKKVTHEVNDNKSNHSVKHYQKNHSHIPPWIATKALYFGTTINWYKILPPKLKEKISEEFFKFTRLKIDEKKELLIIVMNLLHEYRNNIAHGSRTFLSNISNELNKTLLLQTIIPQVLTQEEFDLDIGKKDLFAVILSIALLINDRLVFEKYLVDLSTVTLGYEELELKLSPKGNFYKTLNIPENFIDRITEVYNMKFTS